MKLQMHPIQLAIFIHFSIESSVCLNFVCCADTDLCVHEAMKDCFLRNENLFRR